MLFKYFIFCLALLSGIISLQAMKIKFLASAPDNSLPASIAQPHDTIISSLNNLSKNSSAYLATATLTDGKITQAAAEAAKKNGNVQFFVGPNSKKRKKIELTHNGVKTTTNNTIHANAAFFEDRDSITNSFVITTARATANSRNENYEDGIEFKNVPSDFAKKAKKYIESLKDTQSNLDSKKVINKTPQKITLISSDTHDLNGTIEQRIEHAKKGDKIKIATMTINDPKVLKALKDAQERGVKISLAINAPNPCNYSPLKKIATNGKVSVLPKKGSSIFHSKGFLRTNKKDPKRNLFGSFTNNITTQSLHESNLAAIIPAPDLPKEVISDFKKAIKPEKMVSFADFLKKKEEEKENKKS